MLSLLHLVIDCRMIGNGLDYELSIKNCPLVKYHLGEYVTSQASGSFGERDLSCFKFIAAYAHPAINEAASFRTQLALSMRITSGPTLRVAAAAGEPRSVVQYPNLPRLEAMATI